MLVGKSGPGGDQGGCRCETEACTQDFSVLWSLGTGIHQSVPFDRNQNGQYGYHDVESHAPDPVERQDAGNQHDGGDDPKA